MYKRQALEESSATSGATFLTTVRRVTLPLLSPAILGAFIFFLVVALETFEVPAFIGIPGGIYTLSTRIYYLDVYKRQGDGRGPCALSCRRNG